MPKRVDLALDLAITGLIVNCAAAARHITPATTMTGTSPRTITVDLDLTMTLTIAAILYMTAGGEFGCDYKYSNKYDNEYDNDYG